MKVQIDMLNQDVTMEILRSNIWAVISLHHYSTKTNVQVYLTFNSVIPTKPENCNFINVYLLLKDQIS